MVPALNNPSPSGERKGVYKLRPLYCFMLNRFILRYFFLYFRLGTFLGQVFTPLQIGFPYLRGKFDLGIRGKGD